MVRWPISLPAVAAAALAVVLAGSAQPPAASPGPPINPAAARLDHTIAGLDGPGFAIAVSEAADVLAASCDRQTIQYWTKDVLMGIRVAAGTPHVLHGHEGAVTSLASAGTTLVSAGADGKVLVWDLVRGQLRHTLTSGAAVRALAVAADGKQAASGGDDNQVQLWDLASGKPGARLQAHTDWVLALAFSPDGTRLASGGYDGVVRVWEVPSGKKALEFAAAAPPPPNTPPPDLNRVLALAFSPDGKTLAVGGTDAAIHLVNAADGKVVRSLTGHASSVKALAFHPGGAVLASGSKDRTVRLWNPAGGQALKVLEGHTAWVEGIAFAAQGARLASVGADRTVRLWDLTDPKKP
jgi:hypothetical protein